MWVEVDLSMLVQATEAYGDALRNLGQVEVSAEKHTKQLILTGQSYQVSLSAEKHTKQLILTGQSYQVSEMF